ncbi:MAG: hypothetical protein K2F74_06845 [Muribaculaceae bacterium]|nr:hypothetical protein [Muribaculaceae bacterium]
MLDKETIKELKKWLSEAVRDYRAGVALYERHGYNRLLKRRFAMERSAATESMLAEELRKLAGLTAAEYAALRRHARQSAPAEKSAGGGENAAAEEKESAAGEEDAGEVECASEAKGVDQRKDAGPTVARIQRFREKYTFLSEPDCPDELKILVADMFTAYGSYREAHARLQELPDDATAEAAETAEKLVEAYLDNREIREELDYYLEHRVILGRCRKLQRDNSAEAADIAAMDDMTLQRELQNARSNVTKWRKRVATAEEGDDGEALRDATEAAERWIARKEWLEAEVEKRKKK